ncbi:MAG: NAD(P)/FAD-dependent oxidoreductase [Kordiimonas sp.]
MRIRDDLHDDHLPDTYYRATCTDLEPFRRLEGSVQAQVCVVGGGVSGVSVALELAERGYSVALVEQNYIGWGASGRSGGQILTGPTNFARYEASFGADNAKAAWAMSVEGAGIVKDRVKKYSIDCDLKWGGVEIARTVSEDAGLQAKAASLKLYNQSPNLRYLGQDTIGQYINSDRVTSGLYRSDWGRCHPLNLVRQEARVAERLGAKIYEDARVSGIDFGESVVVDTGHGKVTAETVVLAGNAYLGPLVPELTEKFTAVGTYLMATEPLEDDLARNILPENYMIRAQGDEPVYLHLTPDNRVLFGALNSHTGKHPRKLAKALTHKMHSLLPELEGVNCEIAWGVFIGVGEANIPQIGKLAENVLYAQAYTGRGVADAHLAGRLIGEVFDGDDRRLRILSDVEHPVCRRKGLFGRSIDIVSQAFSFSSKAS